MSGVTERDIEDVLRAWAYKWMRDSGFKSAKVCDVTGIQKGDLSKALRHKDNKTVTWLMLLRIANAPELKTPLSRILAQLGEAFALAEHRVSLGQPAVPVAELPPERGETDEDGWVQFEGEAERRALVAARRKQAGTERPQETRPVPRAKKNH
jgi:hypothetical protein